MIEFRCQSCRANYKVKDKYGGKISKCKKCGEKIEIPYPPLELPDEVTEGGSVVHRHEARMRDFEMAVGDSENIEKISDHIEKHIGPIEMVSDMVTSMCTGSRQPAPDLIIRW